MSHCPTGSWQSRLPANPGFSLQCTFDIELLALLLLLLLWLLLPWHVVAFDVAEAKRQLQHGQSVALTCFDVVALVLFVVAVAVAVTAATTCQK